MKENKLKSSFLYICLLLLLLIRPAVAADIEALRDSKGYETSLLSGKIVSGDTKKIAKFFVNKPLIQLLYVDSRGGDVIEAIRLGELLRTLRIQISVADKGVCASACFFLWINGAYRLAVTEDYRNGSGPVGLHRPFLENPGNHDNSLQMQSNAMNVIRNYLEVNLIPRRLVDVMMSRPSNDIYWLTNDDLNELGPIPPALEELYIAKCQANVRQLGDARLEAKIRRDVVTIEKIDTRLREIFNCTSELNNNAHEAAIRKLRASWLPPIPFGTRSK